MITIFASPQSDGSVGLSGRIRTDECSDGHFRQRLRAGSVFCGIKFDEWATLASVEFADDGAVTKHQRIKRDHDAERPPFVRGIP